MIKDFFIKKETLVILGIAIVSIFFVVLGFLFLFFKSGGDIQPRIIPSNIDEITWSDFSSKIIRQKIIYPKYMYVAEKKEDLETIITFAEFKPQNSLNYFSNQNHFSIYPEGSSEEFFYGKTRESDYQSDSGQVYKRVEYLTYEDEVWGVLFIPKETPTTWTSQGFIWMQTQIQNRKMLCISESGIIATDVECDLFAGQKIVYSGVITGQFITLGYEIINKNKFE